MIKGWNEITRLAAEGHQLVDQPYFTATIDKYKEALSFLTPPSSDLGESTWLNISIGEAYYKLKNYGLASYFYHEAYCCPDGHQNPFVLLRLGQCFLHLHKETEALYYLHRAYVLKADVLLDSDREYLQFLSSKISL